MLILPCDTTRMCSHSVVQIETLFSQPEFLNHTNSLITYYHLHRFNGPLGQQLHLYPTLTPENT